ncbi:MAG: cell envelope integrity protein CreD [bacterium]|nr:cell envelope integrity protein CreD [bacterium]
MPGSHGTITGKLFAIAFIGGLCFVASLVVFGPVDERQTRYNEAKEEIANSWSKRQVMIGPMVVGRENGPEHDIDIYVLPETLHYETVLVPEVRTRGIFRTVVYNSTVNVSGEFLGEDIRRATTAGRSAVFSVVITDTRGIEKQVDLEWNGTEYPFNPGPGVTLSEQQLQNSSGLHALVPVNTALQKVPFSFTIELKGSEGVSIAPVGKETVLEISSSWPTPKFVGAFLPSQRSITESGFTSEWRISSFGRPYPQTWEGDSVNLTQLLDSAAGVNLHEQIDAYDNVFRSIKYAILFIVITFAAFFFFDVIAKVRVHPIHYILIGSALALFYLLLLSLSEHIGFPAAYLVATTMIVLLVSSYSAFVLKHTRRALPIFLILTLLYSYLYFVLQLEDYALLCGALLLFAILAATMFATRHIDWYALDKSQ